MNDSLSDAASIIQKNFVAGATSRYIAEMLAADGLLAEPGECLETLRALCAIATTNGIGLSEIVGAYLALTKETS